jgi:ketosteroid isomerase-like protein
MVTAMADNTDPRAVLDRYAAAVVEGDRAAFVALFIDDCEVVDPYPSTRYSGTEGVRHWWDTLIAPMSDVRIEIREHHVCGDRVAAAYTTTGSPQPGVTVQLQGIDVLTIVGSRIAALEAYWDPAEVRIIDGG